MAIWHQVPGVWPLVLPGGSASSTTLQIATLLTRCRKTPRSVIPAGGTIGPLATMGSLPPAQTLNPPPAAGMPDGSNDAEMVDHTDLPRPRGRPGKRRLRRRPTRDATAEGELRAAAVVDPADARRHVVLLGRWALCYTAEVSVCRGARWSVEAVLELTAAAMGAHTGELWPHPSSCASRWPSRASMEQSFGLTCRCSVGIEDLGITNSAGEGIAAIGADDCLLRNSTVFDTGDNAVRLRDLASGCQLLDNVIRDAGGSPAARRERGFRGG